MVHDQVIVGGRYDDVVHTGIGSLSSIRRARYMPQITKLVDIQKYADLFLVPGA